MDRGELFGIWDVPATGLAGVAGIGKAGRGVLYEVSAASISTEKSSRGASSFGSSGS